MVRHQDFKQVKIIPNRGALGELATTNSSQNKPPPQLLQLWALKTPRAAEAPLG
jgi:hypothetical protein